jgi:hypothetical protein
VITITEQQCEIQPEKVLNPCQLKKIWGSGQVACTFDCAFDHNCPVFYVNAKGEPIIQKALER